MPNLAFHFEVLKHVTKELSASGNPIATKIAGGGQSLQFAVLGAMGPDVFSYNPISPALAGFLAGLVPTPSAPPGPLTAASALASLNALTGPGATNAQLNMAQELYFNPLGATYSVLFSSLVVPLWPTLNQLTSILNQLDAIVASRDTIGAVSLASTLSSSLSSITSALAGVPATIAVLTAVLGAIIAQPPWMEESANGGSNPFFAAVDPIVDRRHEFLRWHHTGLFAKQLMETANASGQTNLQAYAFGWLCHLAASVTAEPFVNNIVGGPYRTHWWRNRLAGNFVDSWTFGFFESPVTPAFGGPTGDNPTPPYFVGPSSNPAPAGGWPLLCNSNLETQFDVANLAGTPPVGGMPAPVVALATGNMTGLNTSQPLLDISNLLMTTMKEVYKAPHTLDASGATLPIVGIDANTLQEIQAFAASTFPKLLYVGAFAVYWFMTSGSGVVGNNPTGTPTGLPPPAWLTGLTSGSLTPQQAGAQAASGAINPAGVICAILLAIAAIFNFLTGNFVAGAADVVAALDAPVINWTQVANDAFWMRSLFVTAENSLRDALVYGGLAYPPPVMLGTVNAAGNTLPATDLTSLTGATIGTPTGNVPATLGVPLTKTNSLSAPQLYPRQIDTSTGPTDLSFATYPSAITPKVEELSTDPIIAPGLYPNSVIKVGAVVLNGGIAAAPTPASTADVNFGDAVANAVQVIKAVAKGLPDYNLDADRGYGWNTWVPETTPTAGLVQPVPES